MTPRTSSEFARLRWTDKTPRVTHLLGALFCLAGVAHAQTTTAPPNPGSTTSAPPPTSSGLTWRGLTLYGIVDIGLQYDTHAAPFSDYFMASSSDIVQKNSRRAISGVTSNNLSVSRIGLQGTEPLFFGDWSGVFKLETLFNPSSGELGDAAKSLTQNNGVALANQTTNLDSSISGQVFQQSYAGVSSPTYGTLTFGRQNTVLADGVAKYDPNAASQAFSLVGLSGTAAGGGDTQDRRMDSSVKYGVTHQNLHFGAQYRFSDSASSGNSAYEFSFGGEYAGLSADLYYTKVKSAIALSALSAAQVASLPALGYSPSNALAGTISDNTTYGLMAMYNFAPFKFFGAYENITFKNPSAPLQRGFTVANYVLAVVNNTNFGEEKILSVYWAGVKYSFNKALDLTAAYYDYHQTSFATGATAGCTSIVAASCRGDTEVASIDAVYKLSKRFDTYAGAMWSEVKGGSANGFIYSKNNINPTIGVRFTF